MRKNGLASCKEDLMVLDYFNLEIPNHLLAKKYSLDRHTIQKYVKENLLQDRSVLKDEEFKYFENRYLNENGEPNSNSNLGASNDFLNIEEFKVEDAVRLPFLELSSNEEIFKDGLKTSPTTLKKQMDLFDGILDLNQIDQRRELNEKVVQLQSNIRVVKIKDEKKKRNKHSYSNSQLTQDGKYLEEELCKGLNFWEIESIKNTPSTVPSSLVKISNHLYQPKAVQR